MADEPFIIPTFTFDTFRKNRLSVTEHTVGARKTNDATDPSGETSSDTLMSQLKEEGIEIDSPYEAFFTDGAPPPSAR